MVTMICESDKITMAIAIIASFLWVFMEGFSVLAIGMSVGIPDYILKNPCWLIVNCLVFKGVCVWCPITFGEIDYA